MMDKQSKRAVRRIIAVYAAIVLTAAGTVCAGIKHYIDRVPDISPYENLQFAQHSDLLPDDLAAITCEDPDIRITKRIVDAFWADDTREGVVLEMNGRCVSVGERTGLLFVTVYASGVEAREVTVPVRIG